MILINGESKHQIDINDRGLQYGDGLFETICILKGKPLFFAEHFKRLIEGCERLNIPQPSWSDLNDDIARLVVDAADKAIVKIILTRGAGGRGYRYSPQTSPTRIISLHTFPDYPENYATDGVRVTVCQHKLSINPYFAGIKHLNRLEQVMARNEWSDEDDLQEGLMMDQTGRVVEGTMTNLFFAKDGRVYTPMINRCGVKGIIRGEVIKMAKELAIDVTEREFDLTQLADADEVFLTNSVIGIWPVAKLDNWRYNIGSVTRKFQQYYLTRCHND